MLLDTGLLGKNSSKDKPSKSKIKSEINSNVNEEKNFNSLSYKSQELGKNKISSSDSKSISRIIPRHIVNKEKHIKVVFLANKDACNILESKNKRSNNKVCSLLFPGNSTIKLGFEIRLKKFNNNDKIRKNSLNRLSKRHFHKNLSQSNMSLKQFPSTFKATRYIQRELKITKNVHTNKINVTILISILTLLFFFCQFPVRILIVWSYVQNYYSPVIIHNEIKYHVTKTSSYIVDIFSDLLSLIYFFHCISNPIIYNILSTKFRNAFNNLKNSKTVIV